MTNPSHLKVRYLSELPELPPEEVENSWMYSYVPNGPDKDYKVHLPDVVEGSLDIIRDELLDPADGFGADMIAYRLDAVDAVERSVRDKLGDIVSIKDFGAVGDGVTNDASAELSAHSTGGAVLYPRADGMYFGAENPRNLYGNYRNALWGRVQSGLYSDPESDASPVAWFQKISSADRSINPSEWDQGGVYSSLIKVSGNAYGAGLTGYARHDGGGGQVIGVHGRGVAMHANAQVWGGWSYANDTANGSISIIGHEINVKKVGPDIGWQDTTAVGNTRGLVIVTADTGGPATHALYIGAHNTVAGTDGWYTGVLIRQDSIRPCNESVQIGNGEAIRLQGSSTNSRKYGGIRLHKGTFQYGLSTTEASFHSNCAILIGVNQRIVFGTRPTNGTYLTFTEAGMLDLRAAVGFGVGGNKVVGSRRTGWGSVTGTTDKSGFSTYTAPVMDAAYNQADVQALADAVQSVSRHLGALIGDLRTHGLIGE